MNEQQNVQLVQEAYAAFQRGDIQSVLDRLSDEIVWNTPGPPAQMPLGGTRKGQNEVMSFFSMLMETEDIEHFEPVEIVAQGDKVVSFVSFRCRFRATGRTYETELAHVFTIRNGKIAAFREFYDTAAALPAMGFVSAQAVSAV